MLTHLPLSADSARTARGLVAAAVRDLGRPDLLDDAAAVVSELVANAVLHARTPIALTVEPRGEGVRVGVSDGSHIMPRWSPASATATSGRGLLLVEQLSATWGVEPLDTGGKTVWAQLDEPAPGLEDRSVEDLLARWVDDPVPLDPAQGRIQVSVSIDVQAMLDSRAHTGDLVRELQLTLLDDASNVTGRDFPPEIIHLARRLVAATEEFHEPRRQVWNQTLAAAQEGLDRVTLHLELRSTDAVSARQWLEALDDADALTTAGTLLLPPFPAAMTAFRRYYIEAIIDQLRRDAPAAAPTQ